MDLQTVKATFDNGMSGVCVLSIHDKEKCAEYLLGVAAALAGKEITAKCISVENKTKTH